jgi:hypothetical protein
MTSSRPAAWREQFLSLAADLAVRDAATLTAAAQAIDDPQSYLDRYDETAERLGDRPDAAADPQVPWLALVDRLLAALRAVEIDWRTDRDDIAWSLQQLVDYAALPQSVRDAIARLSCGDSIECLVAIAALVAETDRRLVVLDIDSDSYVVMLLDNATYLRTTMVAESLGFVLRDIRDHDPNA